MKFILVLMITISIGFAQDIVPMKRDGVKGFWVSTKTMDEFRKINEEKKLLEAKSLSLEQLAIAKDTRIDFYRKEADKAYTAYKSSESRSFWKSSAFFILGVAATGFASYAAIRTTK